MAIPRPALLFATLLAVTACTATPSPTTAAPGVRSGAPRSGHVSATRSEEECRDVVANGPTTPDAKPSRPMHRSVVIPALGGVPREMAGVTLEVRLFVDIHGRVVPDSTRVSPTITSPRFARDFRASIEGGEFWPAVVEGCAVPAWTTMHFVLPG